MPDPQRLLTTLRRAADAFRVTPGRKGHVITLTDCDELLVAGDLHGHLDNFRILLKRADLGNRPRRHFVLQEVIHGPFRYPSGGDKSHQLLDLVAALKVQFPRQVHFLLGNHELSQWTEQSIEKADEDLNTLFRDGVASAYGDPADEVYAAYLQLFAVAPLALRTPNRVFLSHSLPSSKRVAKFDLAVLEREEFDEKDLVFGGTVHSLVWGRDTSLATATALLQKVDADLLITGHIPCDRGFEAPNERQLILDSLGATGCCCLFPTDKPLTHADLLAHVTPLGNEPRRW
ncbi:MAG TPA: metallophosphoesterase [Gemmataceae bacterium]|nr:metallophosphoesterase [Gemmataceae bacterium]